WGGDWAYAADEHADNAFLDQANDSVVVGSYVLAGRPAAPPTAPGRQVLRVGATSTAPRSAYGISGQSTELKFDLPSGGWRKGSANGGLVPTDSNDEMRSTQL